MDNKYLVLSDIHGNLSALDAVLADCAEDDIAGIILLGDCIDYGMRSNEIIKRLIELKRTLWKDKIVADIWGNHERLIIDNDLDHLSSERGRAMAKYTKQHLSKESLKYILSDMHNHGMNTLVMDGFKSLFIHGSLEDHYWKSIAPNNLNGDYHEYDLVFSGHSHYSHCFTHFYPIDNTALRNKKAVMFINPGSVGQPRNQNPYAQYAVINLPSKKVELRAVEYDIKMEQSLYSDEVDAFYRERLTLGV